MYFTTIFEKVKLTALSILQKKKKNSLTIRLLSPLLPLLWLPVCGFWQRRGAQRGLRHLWWSPALEKPDRNVFSHQPFCRSTDYPFSLIQYGNCSHSAGGIPQELDWGIIWGSVMSYSPTLGPHKCPPLCLSYLYRRLKTLCLYKLETIRLSQQRQPEAIF